MFEDSVLGLITFDYIFDNGGRNSFERLVPRRRWRGLVD